MVELAAIAVHLFAILCISVSAEIELPGNLYQAQMLHPLLLSSNLKVLVVISHEQSKPSFQVEETYNLS